MPRRLPRAGKPSKRQDLFARRGKRKAAARGTRGTISHMLYNSCSPENVYTGNKGFIVTPKAERQSVSAPQQPQRTEPQQPEQAKPQQPALQRESFWENWIKFLGLEECLPTERENLSTTQPQIRKI